MQLEFIWEHLKSPYFCAAVNSVERGRLITEVIKGIGYAQNRNLIKTSDSSSRVKFT